MNLLRESWTLLRRDLVLEWRTPFALGSVLLYVCSTVFIVFSALTRMPPQLWNAIFWVIMLFSAVSVVLRSFIQESGHRKLYYYQLAHPLAVLFSRMVYNTVLLFVLGLLCWGALSILTVNPVEEIAGFILAIALGSVGLSIALTFISAIAAQAGNNATLMAILGFPIIIPILLTLVRFSAAHLGMLSGADTQGDIVILLAIDLMLLGVAIVLYPYLWRE